MSFPRLLLIALLAFMQFPAVAADASTYQLQGFEADSLGRDSRQSNHARLLRLRDGANWRDYYVVTNELHVARQIIAIDSQPDVESLQRFATALEAVEGKEVGLVLCPTSSVPTLRNRRFLVRAAPNKTNNGSVAYAIARQHARKFVPNDTFFSRQWHLRNTQGNGVDISVTNAWDKWRGSNVLVGIVDDGIEISHSDLSANVNLDASWDFNGQDADPSPRLAGSCDAELQSANCHGTAVAGLVAARGNNGTGVSGVAFEAQIAGIRLISDPTTDEEDAAAMLHRNDVIAIKNNSWGAPDCDLGVYAVLEGPGPLMRDAVRVGAATGRDGKGIIYTWAGGNGRSCGEDVNYDGYANMVEVIAIGAVTGTGAQASYSEPGACLVAVAPSSGGGQAITTTDLSNEHGYNTASGGTDLSNPSYTSTFGGTSAATPIASGVVALMLQANPALNYRDVKEILLRSGTRVQPADGDWVTNSAGISHNHKFGGGLVNASNAIAMAKNWISLGQLATLSLADTNMGIAIPDANPTGVSRTFTFTQELFRVENVAITLTAPHSRWGDLVVTLTSPSGALSRLSAVHTGDAAYSYQAWTFNSVRHWGEHVAGEWTVTVADPAPGNAGALDALDVTLFVSRPQAVLRVQPADGGFNVILSSPAVGWRFSIEAASILNEAPTSWTEIGIVTVPPSFQISIADPSPQLGQRFYRARLLE